MSGLRRYLDVCCSSAVARSLVCAARFLVSDMWMPAEGAFRYTSCPHSPPAPDLNFLILDGLVHAYVLTGDPALAEVVEVAGGRHMDFVMQNSDDLDQDHDQGVGKIVSMTMCFTPAIVGTVDRISRAHQGA